MNHVLLAIDDEGLRKGVTDHLVDLGYRVSGVPLGKNTLVEVWRDSPDVIIIGETADWHKARILCKELKQEDESREIPLIALIPETKGRECPIWDLVEDFILLPYRPEELGLRIRQVQRRRGLRLSGEVARIGDLVIDFSSYEVSLRGISLTLTYREYELLRFLVTHPNRVFSRDALLKKVWGYEAYVGTRTVDIHIRRLRSKLGDSGSGIQTVRNVGYKFARES